MKTLIFAALSLMLIPLAAIAQQQTLWTAETFTQFPIISPEIDNSSNRRNGIKVFIVYHDLTPDFAQPGVRAVIEEEISAGVWRIVAAQNELFANENIAPQRTLLLEPTFVADAGVDLFIDDGAGGQRISSFDGTPGANLRLRIIGNQTPLTSINLSAYVELFDR